MKVLSCKPQMSSELTFSMITSRFKAATVYVAV